MQHLNKEIHMNRFLRFCGVLLFIFYGFSAHAELKIDTTKKTKAIEATLDKVTATRNGYWEETAIYSTIGGTYFGEDALNGKPAHRWSYATRHFEGSLFGWIFNGKSYISSIGSYRLRDARLPDRCNKTSNPNANCTIDEISGQPVCHLFLFDSKTVDTVAIVQLNIKRDGNEIKGMPSCDGVKAMAIAKEVSDAMLITLSYFDGASHDSEPADYSTTVLLRFSNQNGKLKIEQDDRCLGNPNKYKTIAAARNALGQCAPDVDGEWKDIIDIQGK